MNKSHIMSLIKISTITVETFIYEDTQAPVALWTFDQYPEVHLTARWDPDRPPGRRGEKLSDKVYVWTPPKREIPGLFKLPWMGRPRRELLNGGAGLPHIRAADVYEIRER